METTARHFEHWPIVGHDGAVDQLARAVHTDRVNHAYLFTGPEGVGRRTLARNFAQALVCTAPGDQRPCGDCSACRRAAANTFPDISVLSLETQAVDSDKKDSQNTVISIESVRELRASVALRPMESQWRIAVLEDVDRLSFNAYDALLKTLEEPPPFVVMLLIATEFAALPETIRSRCRHINLEPVPRDVVAAELERRGASSERAELVARLTRGRIGRALALASDDDTLAERAESVKNALEMMRDPLNALAEARRMADLYRRGQRDRVYTELDLLLGLWRDVLLYKTGRAEDVSNIDVLDDLVTLSRGWTVGEIHSAVTACMQGLRDLNVNVQARLALNAMVTQWPEPR